MAAPSVEIETENEMDCPCGSGGAYAECCEPIITGAREADTPEQLMRARYSASLFWAL